MAVAGAIMLLVALFVAIFAGWIAPFDPKAAVKVTIDNIYVKPGGDHLLGTDDAGKDVLSNLFYGARVSLLVGFFASFISLVIGGMIGLTAGFFGGRVDNLLMRLTDVLLVIPDLPLMIVLIAFLGRGLGILIFVIGILGWTGTARVVRASILSEKTNQYIEAAPVIGCSNWRIMFRHLLPNVMASIIVIMSVMVGVAILVEAALSFLGLGVRPPTASWGQMLSIDGRTYMLQQPWLAIWPGAAISVIVLSLNLLGDALRDLTDPKLRMR